MGTAECRGSAHEVGGCGHAESLVIDQAGCTGGRARSHFQRSASPKDSMAFKIVLHARNQVFKT